MNAVPVLVGAGAVSQRKDDPTSAHDQISLMRLALNNASTSVGHAGTSLIDHADLAIVPAGLWAISDPARMVLGDRAKSAKTVLAHIGVLQQSVLTRAANAIANGEATSVIVMGGETKYRALRAAIMGIELAAPEGSDEGTPNEVMVPAQEVITALEIERGLSVPAHQYALLESALGARAGRTPAEQGAFVATLVSTLSEVAVANPAAWSQVAMSAELVATAAPVALPYTKPCCSQWNVDQAAALVLTSEANARALGIDPARFIYPVAAAESNLMVPVTERAVLEESAAARLVGEALESAAGIELTSVDLLELYSCFPAAVEIQANEFGLDLEARPFSVTGGMHFGGGPLNNFCLQALVRLVELMRDGAGDVAALTAVSGMFTKFGASIWSRSRPSKPFVSTDVTDAARQQTKTCSVDGSLRGEVTVVAATRTSGASPLSIILGERDGIRSLATSSAPQLSDAVGEGLVGSSVVVDGPEVVSLGH